MGAARRRAVALMSLAVMSLAVTAPRAAASPISAPTRELEVRVWTADEHELPAMEREVVRLLQLNPHSAAAHHLLSHVHVRLFSRDPGDLYLLKQASDLAQQAVDLAPREALGYVALADILDLMGNADRALRLLDEAEASGIEPNWRFYFTRARLTADEAGAEKVLGLLDAALGFADTEPRIIVPYVVAMLQAEAQGEALIAKLATWNERYPSPLFKLTMAITYAEQEKYEKAHALYTEILKADPKNREAKVNDAIVLYRDLHDSKSAVTLLEQVLAEHRDEMTDGVRGMVTAHLGAAYLASKTYAQAEARFAEAIQVDQDNTGVLDFVTREYRGDRAHPQLVSLIRRLNDRLRGMGVLHALLGETLSEHLARHDDALAAFEDAITLEPGRSDFYNGMGLTYYRKQSYDLALKLFTTATEVDPSDATARYNVACAQALLGQADEALATLAEALSLDPRLMQTAREDRDFASVRGSLKFQELVQGSEDPAGEIGH